MNRQVGDRVSGEPFRATVSALLLAYQAGCMPPVPGKSTTGPHASAELLVNKTPRIFSTGG